MKPWQGIYFALQPGPACTQRDVYAASSNTVKVIGSEDCLYLNIWAPAFQPESIPQQDRRLPVMVWIHGGSNIRGEGSTFRAETFVLSQKVIVVTVNYRLGAFGWFRHPSLRSIANNDEDRSGNYGTLDIITALEWVKKNIAAFGGDPERITLFGESAGGWNVCTLLASPKAAGLFQRAIVQSGSPSTFDPQISENYADDFIAGDPQSSGEVLLQLLLDDGLADNRDAAKATVAAMGNCAVATYLHNKSAADFETAYKKIRTEKKQSVLELPMLFRDGSVLPADGVETALAEGRFNKVPVIFGATQDEYTLLLTLFPDTPFVQQDPSTGIRIKNHDHFYRAAYYLSRLLTVATVNKPLTQIAQHLAAQTFSYTFNWNFLLPAPIVDNIQLGATHGLDVVFLFGMENLGPEFLQIPLIDQRYANSYRFLSDAMMSYWAEFAYSGNPARGRCGKLPLWESWCPEKSTTSFVLDDPHKGGLRMQQTCLRKVDILDELKNDLFFSSAAARCVFLHALYSIGRRFALLNEFDYGDFCHDLCTSGANRQAPTTLVEDHSSHECKTFNK